MYMQYSNKVCFSVSGRRALFSDPLTRVGGEKFTYPIPTYEALKGIAESIFWKPTFVWVIDRVRIMKRIETECVGVRPILYGGGNTLSMYTYLKEPKYIVEAHFEWNECRADLECDRNENKHFYIAKRMIEKGGRRDIFLGTRECQGYVEPCGFFDTAGDYDNSGEQSFALMVHGIDYPDEYGDDKLRLRMWYPKMVNGVIDFPRPEDCTVRRVIKKSSVKTFSAGENFSPIDDLFLQEGGVPE